MSPLFLILVCFIQATQWKDSYNMLFDCWKNLLSVLPKHIIQFTQSAKPRLATYNILCVNTSTLGVSRPKKEIERKDWEGAIGGGNGIRKETVEEEEGVFGHSCVPMQNRKSLRGGTLGTMLEKEDDHPASRTEKQPQTSLLFKVSEMLL